MTLRSMRFFGPRAASRASSGARQERARPRAVQMAAYLCKLEFRKQALDLSAIMDGLDPSIHTNGAIRIFAVCG